MKTKNKSLIYYPLWVLSAIILMAGCTKENDQMAGNPADQAPLEDFQLKSGSADQNRLLAEIRAATARYHNIEEAYADGYILGSPCVSSPEGGMGYHLINLDLVMDNVIDHRQPEALVYEPMKNGRMRLVAVEYIVPYPFWDQAEGVPVLGNKVFDDMPNFPEPLGPNYQLHVWVWKNNPAGIYNPYNPNVNCEFAF
jgi:hypothetical protein